MGSFLSLDLIVFFFLFELTLVPSYFIIAGWGHQRRAYAAIKFFLYTFLGSAFLLVGILALAFIHQSQYHYLTFSLGPLMQTHLSSSTGILLFLAFTAAFAVKAPALPAAHLVARRLHRGPRGGLGPARRACWPSWAPTGSSASTSACSPRPPGRSPRCSSRWP